MMRYNFVLNENVWGAQEHLLLDAAHEGMSHVLM